MCQKTCVKSNLETFHQTVKKFSSSKRRIRVRAEESAGVAKKICFVPSKIVVSYTFIYKSVFNGGRAESTVLRACNVSMFHFEQISCVGILVAVPHVCVSFANPILT